MALIDFEQHFDRISADSEPGFSMQKAVKPNFLDLKTIAQILLNPASSEGELRDGVHTLCELFENYSCIKPFMPEGTDGGDIYLDSGMALRPSDAAACALEYKRTVEFLRGTFSALTSLVAKKEERGVNVLYAGCGPYATLIFPLLSCFDPEDLNVTLLDVNAISLESAKNIADAFELLPYIDDVVLADATRYVYPKNRPLDMVLTETMQVSLKKEPHVSVVQNLAPQLQSEGVLIPEKVTVEAVLNYREKDEMSWPLFTLTKETRFKHSRSETVTIALPRIVKAGAQLYYRSAIYIYSDNRLEDNQCSLTMPRRVIEASALYPGENIEFYYELSSTPDFVVTRADEEKSPVAAYLKLPFVYDREALLRDLDTVDESIWTEHVNTGCYEGNWSAVSLLSFSGESADLNVHDYQYAYKPTPLLEHCGAFNDILQRFQTTLYSVRLMKLAKCSVIKTHTDVGTGYEEGIVRLHVPVQTDESIYVVSDGKKVRFEAGCCYYLDASKPHSVHNASTIDRVHLVIDCKLNMWLKEVFRTSGFIEPARANTNRNINAENVDEVAHQLCTIGSPKALELADSLRGNFTQGGEVGV